MITIAAGDATIDECVSAIIVPDIATSEPGYIKVWTANPDSGAKHEFHALAQMAYFQVQDDELDIGQMDGECVITLRNEVEVLKSGLVIYRTNDGIIHVVSHGEVHSKKLLEAAYRYCTRWVRLDI